MLALFPTDLAYCHGREAEPTLPHDSTISWTSGRESDGSQEPTMTSVMQACLMVSGLA